MGKRISTAETALNLAVKAEKGDKAAAYELALLAPFGSVTEFVEFVAPDGPTFRAFDAIADGFSAAQFIQRKAGT